MFGLCVVMFAICFGFEAWICGLLLCLIGLVVSLTCKLAANDFECRIYTAWLVCFEICVGLIVSDFLLDCCLNWCFDWFQGFGLVIVGFCGDAWFGVCNLVACFCFFVCNFNVLYVQFGIAQLNYFGFDCGWVLLLCVCVRMFALRLLVLLLVLYIWVWIGLIIWFDLLFCGFVCLK